jgi:hypothetical protein
MYTTPTMQEKHGYVVSGQVLPVFNSNISDSSFNFSLESFGVYLTLVNYFLT